LAVPAVPSDGVDRIADQAKTRHRTRVTMARARLIVLVSHELESTCLLCDRVLWLDRDSVRQEDPADEVLAASTSAMPASATLAG
jgi:ABC-type polysaccharide/polyol phosphate transport system ATPase subunit